MGKVILDLCGGSGSWSKPYKDNGYDVEVLTLPHYDVTKVDFGTHAMHFELQTVHYKDTKTVLYKDVYGILAAPPCTEFSVAKGNAPRDFEGAMQITKACLEIIWKCRINGNLKFWALENPRGFMRQFLGIPKYTFEQWEFGEDKIKPTDIWGYFNHPISSVKEKPGKLSTNTGKRSHSVEWSKACEIPADHEDYIKSLKTYPERRAAIRAITPKGFAEAFYKANK